MEFHDHYEALHLEVKDDPEEFSLKQINNAYKKAARKYHPDKEWDRIKFEAAQKAIEVLRNYDERKKYDAIYRLRIKEKKRLAADDQLTKRLKADLEQRERAANTQNQTFATLQKLREETEALKYSSKKQHSNRIKVFTLEEHLAREKQILEQARKMRGSD